MNLLWVGLSSFFGALLSSMGMGGGGILLLYLTLVAGMEQQAAQGINLVFYLPVALVALCLHAKNRLICWRVALPCILVGVAGVWAGSRAAFALDSQWLGKLFGGFLLVIAVRELLWKPPDSKNAG